ncbi:Uncharacterised protein [Mycolicibacterium vanbaalenii]|uniref:Uncharacterized protein n=1 Tax=Mycolicibacterium vanbaalenii TaxID=110539 RepID=A0A5S9R690_MYCVN|nr:Uncharacterised protein [Mycolicibacterium vanbaalenii]
MTRRISAARAAPPSPTDSQQTASSSTGFEAVKYDVLPLDDRGFERINPDIAGRPQLIRGNTQLLFQGMRVSEWCVLTLKNKSPMRAS